MQHTITWRTKAAIVAVLVSLALMTVACEGTNYYAPPKSSTVATPAATVTP